MLNPCTLSSENVLRKKGVFFVVIFSFFNKQYRGTSTKDCFIFSLSLCFYTLKKETESSKDFKPVQLSKYLEDFLLPNSRAMPVTNLALRFH